MSENQNRGISDLSKYDAMTTEELEEILRLDAQAPEEQESDTDKILYIMEVLTERKRNNSHTGKTALEAYETFKQNYMPEIEEPDIYDEKSVAVKRRFPRWLRGLTAAAAVLVILVLGSVTAKAFGMDFWKTVVKWTQETFHFGEWGNSEANDNLPYSSLQEALEKSKITTSLTPNWFPSGYELIDIKVEYSPLQTVYKAKYSNGDQVLSIVIRDHLEGKPVYVEQSEGLVEEYEISGVKYYLFSDINVVKAVWVNGSYECDIFGNVTIEELKMMIDSIEKG